MSISDSLAALKTAKTDIAAAIVKKGGMVNEGDGFTKLAADIDTIPKGDDSGSDVVDYLVQVVDYDGTVLKSERLRSGDTFTLPEDPTDRPRLTFQKWSSPVAITNGTVTVGDSDITIGATYETTSGWNEFDITLTKVTGLTITFDEVGTKDWGDGTTDSLTTHTYADYGDYTIMCDCTSLINRTITRANAQMYVAVRLKDGVKSIGDEAFYKCYSLTSISIPSSVTSIGNYVFQNCYSLASVTIPDGFRSIRKYAFSSCYSLASVTIPSSVTSIGEDAFSSCYSLASVTIPSSITSIVSSVFKSCYSLTSIMIPSSVTSIGSGAFQSCDSLASVTIPSSVKTIESFSFQFCHSLTSITIPEGVNIIGNYVFQNCYSLTSVTIPSSVTSIGNYAFHCCYSLTSVAIPSSVNYIGEYAFSSCYSLASVTIPDGVISFARYTFQECYSMKIYDFSEYTSVPTLGAYAFSGICEITKIMVPAALYDEWIAAKNWSSYANYIYKAPVDISKIYGVSGVGNEDPHSLVRTDSAVGLTANASASDFDRCYPWCEIKEVTDKDGNVFVKIPKFYTKISNDSSVHQISGVKHEGFSTLFIDGKGNEIDYVLIGKYEGSGSASRIYSKSGKAVVNNLTLDGYRTACRANGTGYQQWDIIIDTMIKQLFLIEFATQNSQSIMYGYVGTEGTLTGMTDSITTATGQVGEKGACKYRGIENIWGFTEEWCDGVCFSDTFYVCTDPESYATDKFEAPYVMSCMKRQTEVGCGLVSYMTRAVNVDCPICLTDYDPWGWNYEESPNAFFCDGSGSTLGVSLMSGRGLSNCDEMGLWSINDNRSSWTNGGRLCYKPIGSDILA